MPGAWSAIILREPTSPGRRGGEPEASRTRSTSRIYFVTGYFFFLFGRCVSAEPAAVFEFLPVLLLRNTLDAAVPAFLLVVSLFFATFFPPVLWESLAVANLPVPLDRPTADDPVFTEIGGRLGTIC